MYNGLSSNVSYISLIRIPLYHVCYGLYHYSRSHSLVLTNRHLHQEPSSLLVQVSLLSHSLASNIIHSVVSCYVLHPSPAAYSHSWKWFTTWLKHGPVHIDLTPWFHVASLAMTLKPTSGADALAAGIVFAVVSVEFTQHTVSSWR